MEKEAIKEKVNKEFHDNPDSFKLSEKESEIFKQEIQSLLQWVSDTGMGGCIDLETRLIHIVFEKLQITDYEEKIRLVIKYLKSINNVEWLKHHDCC